MRLGGRLGSIIFRMVIDRDEFRPRQSHSSGPSWPARWRCTFAFPTAPTHATLTSARPGRPRPTPPPPPHPHPPPSPPGVRGGGSRTPPRGRTAGAAHDDHWLHLVGKGANAGKVALPPLVSRHGSDVVGCAQPSERSARRI